VKRWLLVFAACAACRSEATSERAASLRAPTAAPIPTSPPTATATPTPTPSAAPILTDWCIDELSVLTEDACYVLPAQPTRRLLVYLSGIVPPTPDSAQKQTVERVVLQASRRAGVAALIPRGRRGLGPAQARDWWAWPTTTDAITSFGPAMVARWVEQKKALEAIAGAPFETTYLAGSSSGAYFLSALALRGAVPTAAFPVDGFGAMSGGAPYASDARALGGLTPRPFYVGYGAYDAETKPSALGLVHLLQAARWPVRAAEHPFGHGARDVYLDEALGFWEEGAR